MKKKSISKRKVVNNQRRSRSFRKKVSKSKKSIRKNKSLRKNKEYDGMHNGGGSPPPVEENNGIILAEINSRLHDSEKFNILTIDLVCDMIKDVMTMRKTLLIVQSEYLQENDHGLDVAENYDTVISANANFVVSVKGFYIEQVGQVAVPYSHHKIISFDFEGKGYVALVDTQKDRVKAGDISAISAMSEDEI